MRLLLDAHALVWAVDQPARLSQRAAKELSDPNNDLLLSAATIWEIAIKVSLGKLSLNLPYRDWMNKAIADLRLVILPITVDYAAGQASLAWHHRDPFSIVSIDPALDAYGITRLW
jgi:PIN domain nuclease of toxin-antitoxin system